jgi:hypothetical protein
MIASLPLPVLAAALAAAGFVVGLAYFAALRRTTAALAGSGGWRTPAALTVGRVAAALVFLFVAAKLGAVALLAAFAGFLAARAAALRAVRGPL